MMTIEIGLTLAIVGITFFLFIKEVWPTDVNAIVVLALLGLCSQLPGIEPLLTSDQLFSGFSSSASIAIIALMVMAAGIQNTGAMDQVGRYIAIKSDGNERLAVTLLCAAAGITSGFMQNIGAVALFIPVASHLSYQTGIPLSRLLLPMGFCVILGGNLTLLGNGSLIVLNDLIQTNEIRSEAMDLSPLDLFSVFPVGLALLAGGIAFFACLPKAVLEKLFSSNQEEQEADLASIYALDQAAFNVPENSSIAGMTIREFEEQFDVQVIALRSASRRETLAPYRSSIIESHATLAISATKEKILLIETKLDIKTEQANLHFSDILKTQCGGLSEFVLSSRSKLIGNTLHESFFRKKFDATPLVISRQDSLISGRDLNNTRLEAGDLLLVHSPRSSIDRLKDKKELICSNTDCPAAIHDSSHSWRALIIIGLSLLLTIVTPWPVGLCLWLGVLGMFLLNVVSPNEGYNAVSWKTFVMLAGLIPLGVAVDSTGTAEWVSQLILLGLPNNELLIQVTLAALTTLLTLIMSNVGATVILVPIAIGIAEASGISATSLVLLVGLSASNTFLIPTHQANAVILAAGRYKVSDFVKSGGLITLAYIPVEITLVNLMY